MPTTIEELELLNFDDNNIVDTFELSADALSGQKVINVTNAADAAVNDYLALRPGDPTSEIGQIDTGGITGNAITLKANLALLHRNHETVYKLFGNQMKIYRAADIDGTPPPLANFTVYLSPLSIQPDQQYSIFTDPVGGGGFWYIYTYYNVTSGAETDPSLAKPVRGGGVGHYCPLEDIKHEAGLGKTTRTLPDTQVAQRRLEAESEIDGALVACDYILPLQTQNGTLFTPEIIVGIDRILSAGLILSQNFGTTKPGSAKDGKAKTDAARELIAKIQLGDIVLVDSNKQMLLKNTLLNGYPDDTTMDDGENVGAVITMDKIF